MIAIISVFDDSTHTYCYRRGRVVTRAEAAWPTWQYRLRVPNQWAFGDIILVGECIRPTVEEATKHAEADALWHGHGCTVVDVVEYQP